MIGVENFVGHCKLENVTFIISLVIDRLKKYNSRNWFEPLPSIIKIVNEIKYCFWKKKQEKKILKYLKFML